MKKILLPIFMGVILVTIGIGFNMSVTGTVLLFICSTLYGIYIAPEFYNVKKKENGETLL